MCPANPSISEVGVEATKKQTKTELKIQKKNSLLMFQEKECLYTTHSAEDIRFYLGRSRMGEVPEF